MKTWYNIRYADRLFNVRKPTEADEASVTLTDEVKIKK